MQLTFVLIYLENVEIDMKCQKAYMEKLLDCFICSHNFVKRFDIKNANQSCSIKFKQKVSKHPSSNTYIWLKVTSVTSQK